MVEQKSGTVTVALGNGGILRLQVIAPHTFRVRLRQDERFEEPALVRYGIIQNDWQDVEFEVTESEGSVEVRTDGAEDAVFHRHGERPRCSRAR